MASDDHLRIAAATVAASMVVAAGRVREPPWKDAPKLAAPRTVLTAGTICFAAAGTRGLLSLVSVVGTLFPVITVLLALVLLRERLSLTQQLGRQPRNDEHL